MTLLTIDFETYYDQVFSLGNIPTQQYINDQQFEVIGVSVKENNAAIRHCFAKHELIEGFLAGFDFENATVVAHNAMFDGAILEWIFNRKPKRYFCTMMASRPWVVPFTGRSNLAVVSEFFGLPPKGDEVVKAKGKHLEDFSAEDLLAYIAYCNRDVENTYEIAKELLPKFPLDEVQLIDLTIKKFTKPKILIDGDVIRTRLAEIRDETKAAIKLAGVTKSVLMSNQQLAAEMQRRGVVPPRKISVRTGKKTYAFAKTDKDFTALQRNPLVADLVRARLAVKSTHEESRLVRFADLYEQGNPLAAPLLYAGAHTLRFSGLDLLNLQNLARGSVMRQALVAPDGYKFVAADLSQIEARINACLANQTDLVKQFARGKDVYCEFASKLYNFRVTKVNQIERWVGKTAILQLGYQSGWQKFRDTMQSYGVDIDSDEAERVVKTYRNTYANIRRLWATMSDLIIAMQQGFRMQVGPVYTSKDKLHLPNGMCIHYNNMRAQRGGNYVYDYGKERREIYGGKLTENVVQALARIVMTTAELKLARAGLRAVISVHDELVFVVRDEHVEKVVEAVEKALTAQVPWMPSLPVACEVNVGKSYGDCK